VLFLLASGFSRLGWAVLILALLLRWAVAWLVTIPTDNAPLRRYLLWLPLRDMLTAVIWCAGLLSRRVTWRSETFILEPGGLLRPLGAPTPLPFGLRHPRKD